MGIFDLKLGKITLPLYDLGALSAGFYVGYKEGKGILISENAEFLAKYFPTAFAAAFVPLTIKAGNMFKRYASGKLEESLQNGSLKVDLGNGIKKRYDEMSEEEKRKITPNLKKLKSNLESSVERRSCLIPAFDAGLRTGIETFAGYIAGRIYSQIN
jgi:hypothetical protein